MRKFSDSHHGASTSSSRLKVAAGTGGVAAARRENAPGSGESLAPAAREIYPPAHVGRCRVHLHL
ncbi:MAG: hypothetical protein ACLP0J_03435 [Solirubrobacteraceae bacterium]